MRYGSDLGIHAGYVEGRIQHKRLRAVYPIERLPRFVETGTYLGGGVSWALNQHFTTVLSCEYSRGLHEALLPVFAHEPRVQLFCGDSVEWLSLLDLTVRSLYYLDAHDSGGSTEFVPGLPVPLVEEMAVLLRGDMTRSVIAIDDERLWPDEMLQTVLTMARERGMTDVYVDDTVVLVGASAWDA